MSNKEECCYCVCTSSRGRLWVYAEIVGGTGIQLSCGNIEEAKSFKNKQDQECAIYKLVKVEEDALDSSK